MDSQPTSPLIQIINGILYIENNPLFVISGDYPYYRDSVDLWEDRLEKMKAGGINMVTFYVPWRHHLIKVQSGKQICDFDGTTRPNRNVKHFIQLAKKVGLWVCVKTGPFIHAETDYGGLPEMVRPEKNPKIHPQRNHLALKGQKDLSRNKWMPMMGETLPSPLNPEFLRLTKEYYALIAENVLQGQIYPEGPVILLQFLNEGLYSAGRMPYSYSGDYTLSNIQNFRNYLQEKYGSINSYNQLHNSNFQTFDEIFPPTIFEDFPKGSGSPKPLQAIIDWSNYGTNYYSTWINELKQTMLDRLPSTTPLPPLIANWNPEGDFGQGLDVWATRVAVEDIQEECDVNYGYTNWIGCVNYRRSSYLRYSFLCGRSSGINMEENWGFAKMYDWQYRYGMTPLYQTLLAIASGCTGYNVYTAVGTAHWDDKIDSKHERPYPSDCPISETGYLTNKYFLMSAINQYFGELFGTEFYESHQDSLISVGLYQPYVQLAGFGGHQPKSWQQWGLKSAPIFGMDMLAQFHISMRRLKLGYQIFNLEKSHLLTLPKHLRDKSIPSFLVFVSSTFLGQEVQQNLVEYMQNGGILYLCGQLPDYDENYQPFNLLKSVISATLVHDLNQNPSKARITKVGEGFLIYQSGNPFQATRGVKHYIYSLLTTFLTHIKLKLPGNIGLVDGRLLPYSELMGMLGGDRLMPSLRGSTLKSIHAMIRFLQKRGIHREIDLQVRTEYAYRRKIDVFLYDHPTKDIQHVFIFSTQSTRNLRVVIRYYIPQKKRQIRIKTTIVGSTSMLLRVSGGKVHSFIYTGVNPISRIEAPLYLKLNHRVIEANRALDIAYFGAPDENDSRIPSNLLEGKENITIFTAHGSKKNHYALSGIFEKPIALPPKGKYVL